MKASRGEVPTSAPALTQANKGKKMAQADSKNSTTAPAVPSRRLFLSQAAGMAAGGTVLALATTFAAAGRGRPSGHGCEAGAHFRTDRLIADHKAALVATDTAMRTYGDLEETIPACRRAGDMHCNEVTEV